MMQNLKSFKFFLLTLHGCWSHANKLGVEFRDRNMRGGPKAGSTAAQRFASKLHEKSRLLLGQKQIHLMRRKNSVIAILVYLNICELCLKYVSHHVHHPCIIHEGNLWNVWNAVMFLFSLGGHVVPEWIPCQGMLSPRSAEFARFGKRSSGSISGTTTCHDLFGARIHWVKPSCEVGRPRESWGMLHYQAYYGTMRLT